MCFKSANEFEQLISSTITTFFHYPSGPHWGQSCQISTEFHQSSLRPTCHHWLHRRLSQHETTMCLTDTSTLVSRVILYIRTWSPGFALIRTGHHVHMCLVLRISLYMPHLFGKNQQKWVQRIYRICCFMHSCVKTWSITIYNRNLQNKIFYQQVNDPCQTYKNGQLLYITVYY